jgi:hypothetical protein
MEPSPSSLEKFSSEENMADRDCPDCKGKLTGIKLIGTGWENPLTGIAIQTDLRIFCEANAQRGSFSGGSIQLAKI